MTQLESTASIDFLGESAEFLNRMCFCRTLNLDRLQKLLQSDTSRSPFFVNLLQTHPHLFSEYAVFITQEMDLKIRKAIEVIERVIQLPAYQLMVLKRSPHIAHHKFGPRGVCMGFDFHLTQDGPKLIEINTNAGGEFLNIALARAQESCCSEMQAAFVPNPKLDNVEDVLLEMFREEWRQQRDSENLQCIAIIDDYPQAQYLYPEFELFRELFASAGIKTVIADPVELDWNGTCLSFHGQKIDLIYNRLTDFYLDQSDHRSIRLAYEANAVVLTPNPHLYALFADKRNLVDLSQSSCLEEWGVSKDDQYILHKIIPKTRLITSDLVEQFWQARRGLFFKPVSGYGAKAAYRGDKLTQRVWQEIQKRDYIAQELVPPAHRLIEVDGQQSDLKFDVRAYTYDGEIHLLAARMYSGQTTNFRTEGGGFAPVITLPA